MKWYREGPLYTAYRNEKDKSVQLSLSHSAGESPRQNGHANIVQLLVHVSHFLLGELIFIIPSTSFTKCIMKWF